MREKSEIENYMADLAKYQPDAAVDHTPGFGGTPTASESLGGGFLAVRLHDTLDANLVMPDKALMAFNQLLRNLEIPARINGGRLAAAAGSTAFLVFDAAEAALTAAGQILQAAAGQGRKLSVAAAQGQIITGPAEWTGGGGASLLGVPVRQLEELLPDVQPGTLLATAEFARAVEATGASMTEITGSCSGRTLVRLEPPRPARSWRRTGMPPRSAPSPQPTTACSRCAPASLPACCWAGATRSSSELGAGGMAVVYKARDRQLNEVVAIKTIKSEDSQDQALLDAMKSEMPGAQRSHTHRNVLRIYDYGDASGVAHLHLHGIRARHDPALPPVATQEPHTGAVRRRATHRMRQVCTALQVCGP